MRKVEDKEHTINKYTSIYRAIILLWKKKIILNGFGKEG
jgi:hypothetical protein